MNGVLQGKAAITQARELCAAVWYWDISDGEDSPYWWAESPYETWLEETEVSTIIRPSYLEGREKQVYQAISELHLLQPDEYWFDWEDVINHMRSASKTLMPDVAEAAMERLVRKGQLQRTGKPFEYSSAYALPDTHLVVECRDMQMEIAEIESQISDQEREIVETQSAIKELQEQKKQKEAGLRLIQKSLLSPSRTH